MPSLIPDLVKFRLSAAVALSSVTGWFLFKNSIDINLLYLFCGVFLLASGASVLNQYMEREQDALMDRTRARPIPSKKIDSRSALIFSIFLLAAGCFVLLLTGKIPLTLGLTTVILYNFIYTTLKSKTILAIIPGALTGAIPPVIGFTAAGATTLNHDIIVFSLFMLLWQLPHFWIILLRYGDEYRKAGFITFPDYFTASKIRFLIFFWVSGTCLALYFSGIFGFGPGFIAVSAFMNIIFILLFYRSLFVNKAANGIHSAFLLINLYSLSLMLLLIAVSVIK